jgi:hypothetical protein
MWYVRNMSLALDFRILLGTMRLVIFGERVAETTMVHARRNVKLADSVPGRLVATEHPKDFWYTVFRNVSPAANQMAPNDLHLWPEAEAARATGNPMMLAHRTSIKR